VVKFKKKFYVTTAIAYPNAKPHLGHALEIIQADVVARFHRLLGKDVFFQTGTDEHGNKNWQTAQKEGKEIIKFLDENVAVFKDLYKKLNISYDNFIRTSDKKIHYPSSTKLWQALVKAGDIYKKKYKGVYCTGCEVFKTQFELEKGQCPIHPTRKIETVEEENYFFKLSKYKDKLTKIIESDEYKIVPNVRKNEILSFLRIAKDISFSRPKSSLPWGISVPGDPSQVMYVWCDALANYITGVGYGVDEKKFKTIWPADIHIIGKDILRFHAGFWPAMLISAKVPLPKQLFVHGFILTKGDKMSKSTGNVIEPFDQIDKFGVEQFRFYIAGAMPLEGDGEYSEESVKERINSELVGNLANFCYRTLSFTNKYFDSKIEGVDNNNIKKDFLNKADEIKKAYEEFNLKKAIDEILSFSALGNKYFQKNQPWKLINRDKDQAHEVIGLCLNLVKNLSILINPIMPDFSSNLQKQLNLKNLKWDDINFNLKNHKIGKEQILVKKVEEIKEEKFPLNLKVGKILSIEDHPDADKLYVLQVDLGTEKRQLVAGLKDHYKKEDLKNKKIVVLTNLKHAKLRGVESQGMLLAGDDGKKVGILTVKNAEPGTQVGIENFENSNEQINFDYFSKLKIIVKNGKPSFEGNKIKAGSEAIKVEKVKDGARVR